MNSIGMGYDSETKVSFRNIIAYLSNVINFLSKFIQFTYSAEITKNIKTGTVVVPTRQISI